MAPLEEIKEVIQNEGLDKPSRYRDKLYRRYFIIWFLRENKMPITMIGRMLNKHHATVLHALEQHELMMRPKTGDDHYKEITSDLYHRFVEKYFAREDKSGDIFEDILMASSSYDLVIIKKRIKKGYYDNVCTFVGDRAANTVETDQKVGE